MRTLPVFLLVGSLSAFAATPPASVFVEIESDDPDTTLFRHVGTSYGTVGGRQAVITTISKECVAPCGEAIEAPKSDFFISGRGISLSDTFSLTKHGAGVKLRVKTGSSALRFLGWMVGVLSVSALAVGIPLLVIDGARSAPTAPGVQNPYSTSSTSSSLGGAGIGLLIGGAVGLGATVPMIVFSSTKVEFFPLPPSSSPVNGSTSEI